MKKLLLLSTVLIGMLLLPALASATHFTNVVAIGDCSGFSAQLDVHFRSTADYLDFHYDVMVVDEQSMEVVNVVGDMRLMKDGMQDQTFMVSDTFNYALDGNFMVYGTFSLVAPYPTGVDEESVTFENSIACGSVDNDDVSFDSVKALYR